jgi:hypothetical protein
MASEGLKGHAILGEAIEVLNQGLTFTGELNSVKGLMGHAILGGAKEVQY